MNLTNVALMVGVHAIAVATLASCFVRWPALETVALAGFWYLLSGLSVTAGYHRLLAHRSYRCSRVVTFLYLLFGAAAVQNSAINWASDHRRHHAHTDDDGDPYDARRGLWWSHLGWVLQSDGRPDHSNVRDLLVDPLIRWQHRYYPLVVLVMCAILPALIAGLWSDPVGGALWAGAVRLVAQYHATFAVNSAAHRFGRRPYSAATSARDNHLVSLFTMGEGYHNFHHCFPSDYRTGVRWSDYDPTKWLVYTLAAAGLATNLKRVSADRIERARHDRHG